MDGLTIAASLSEMRNALLGAYIRTIHHPAAALYMLRTSGAEPARVLIDISHAAIQLTDRTIPNPLSPSPFAMLLRKHLRGGRVIEIRQHRLDRVVTVEVRRGEGHERSNLELVVELLGVHGNLLLLENGRVLAAARPDRRNRIGEPYVGVEEQPKHDPASLPMELAEAILASDEPARYLMRVVDGVGWAIGLNGGCILRIVPHQESGLTEDRIALTPTTFSIETIYPNPTNSCATITISLPTRNTLDIRVFDILGREVIPLYYGLAGPGREVFHWSGRDFNGFPVASGVYFVKMTQGLQRQSRRIVVVR